MMPELTGDFDPAKPEQPEEAEEEEEEEGVGEPGGR